ncbi:hypothetical protein, partial [Sulfitobacter sp. CW3]
VPASFNLMILELSQLGYIDLRVEDSLDMDATEFFVWLRKGRQRLAPDEIREQRTALMQRAIVELAEQVQQLPETSFVEMASAGALRDQLLK